MSHINEIETVQEANDIASVLVEFVKGEISAAARRAIRAAGGPRDIGELDFDDLADQFLPEFSRGAILAVATAQDIQYAADLVARDVGTAEVADAVWARAVEDANEIAARFQR